ncbi:Hsp70 family protein [Rhodococcoides yunnanense]|uniref:Hsp70 family protein n=1 Tax=Rhodococcoides yunnanense TaxID=278209 RepID=UPI0009348353|nr:Hsp70 family protein [Rhodococcus yunnanensis]
MRVGIGVSTGAEVVCAALLVIEDDGSRTVEYRTVSADTEANTDIGDLVSSAVELMLSLAPTSAGHGVHSAERHQPESIAVSYRTSEQAASIRSACAHSRLTVALVPESAAAHAYLADSGLIARYRSVTVVDIGASGTTTSIIDSRSGAVHWSERTDTFGGDVINGVVKDLVQGHSGHRLPQGRVRDDLRDDRGIGSARYRAVKEHLSTHDSAAVDRADGSSGLDRAEFDGAVRPGVTAVAEAAIGAAAGVADASEAVVLIGGGANIPLVRTVYQSVLRVPVLAPTEPDTVLAKGAAHLALDSPADLYPTAGVASESQGTSVGRFSGAVAGALLVGGIVLAYGIRTLAPTDDAGFSPAGSAVPSETGDAVMDQPIANTTYPTTPVLSTEPESSSPQSSPPRYTDVPQQPESSQPVTVPPAPESTTRTPTLHPAPDLPVIPWPAQPSEPSTVTTPEPTTSVPPTELPSESTPPEPTPDLPSETPDNSTALEPPPPSSIPTTAVDGTPTSPVLAPPPTVWSPPAPAPPASGSSDSEGATQTTTAPNPTSTTEQ